MQCAICNDGKEFKNLSVHLRIKHDITMSEYKKKFLNEVEEVFVPEVVNPLPDILDKYEVTIDDLVEILDKHFEKNKISEEQQQEFDRIIDFETRAEEIAKKLKGKAKIDTQDLYVAEALSKKFGYKVTSVSSNPKTWHLMLSEE